MSVNHFELDLIKYVLVLKKLLEKEKKYKMIHITIYGIFSLFFYNEDVTIFIRAVSYDLFFSIIFTIVMYTRKCTYHLCTYYYYYSNKLFKRSEPNE